MTHEIIHEGHSTIGRYELAVDGEELPAMISYTRPRDNVIYVNYARLPKGGKGIRAGQALAARIVADAEANGDSIVFTNHKVSELFERGEDQRDQGVA